MTDLPLDLSGQVINSGAWLVQALGEGTLKFALCVGYTKTNKVKAVSFEYERWYGRRNGGWEMDKEKSWVRQGPYTIKNSDRCYVADVGRIPFQLLQHIEIALKGDPLYNPEDHNV